MLYNKILMMCGSLIMISSNIVGMDTLILIPSINTYLVDREILQYGLDYVRQAILICDNRQSAVDSDDDTATVCNSYDSSGDDEAPDLA